MANGKTTADVVDVLGRIFATTEEMASRVSSMEKKMSSKPSISDLTSPSKKATDSLKKSGSGVSDVVAVIKEIKGVETKEIIRFSMLPLGLISKKLINFSSDLSKLDVKKIQSNAESVAALVTIIQHLSSTNIVKIFSARKNISSLNELYLGNKGKEPGLIQTISDISKKINDLFERGGVDKLNSDIKNLETILHSMKNITDVSRKMGILSGPTKSLSKKGLTTIDEISSSVVELATKLSKKAEGIKGKLNDSVLPITKFVLMSSLIVFASAGIGAMFTKDKKTILYAASGLSAIAVTSLAISALGILINKISLHTKISSKNILPIVSFVGMSSLILLAATGVGILVKEHLQEAVIGLVGITATIASIVGIAWLVNKVKTTTVKGAAAFVPIFGIAAMSSLMLMMTVGVGVYAEKNGGWKRIGESLGQIGTTIAGYSGIAALAMAALPYTWLGLAGFAPISLLAFASIGITEQTAKLGEHIDKAGGKIGLERIVGDITGTIKMFTENMSDALSGIDNNKQLRRAARTLTKLMKPVSKFTDIISRFEATDDGKIKILHFNKDGEITSGNIVDISLIGGAIANGFSLFSSTILNGLEEAANPSKGKRKIRLIRKVMDPVSRFVDIVTKFDAAISGNTVKLNVLNIDETGNIKDKRTVDIASVSNIISKSFAIFGTNILNGLEEAANPSKGRRKIKLIGKMMDPISKFVDIVSNMTDSSGNIVSIETDETGKVIKKTPIDLAKSAESITNGMTIFAIKLKEGIDKIDGGLFEKSGILGLGKTKLNEVTSSMTEAIEETLKPYKDLDSDKLNKVLSTLNDKHISYIDKLSESIQKTKSPIREYIDEMKELTEAYEKIQPLIKNDKQLVLNVDRHEENNSNVNMDEGNFLKLYEAVIPMIQEAVSSAVIKALGDMSLSLPKDIGTKGGTVTTTIG